VHSSSMERVGWGLRPFHSRWVQICSVANSLEWKDALQRSAFNSTHEPTAPVSRSRFRLHARRYRGQVLHGSARTTETVRRAIQQSQEILRMLARQARPVQRALRGVHGHHVSEFHRRGWGELGRVGLLQGPPPRPDADDRRRGDRRCGPANLLRDVAWQYRRASNSPSLPTSQGTTRAKTDLVDLKASQKTPKPCQAI